MTLSKRAALLIFPVILAGYILTAFQVYSLQKDSISRLEQNRLNQRMTEFKAAFSTYSSFVDSYLFSMQTGERLRLFIAEQDDLYRQTALGASLKRAIMRFQQQTSGFVSFALIGPELDVQYYFENSPDPFASISAEQINFARQALEKGRLTSWEHLTGKKPNSVIQQSALIDSRTFSPPLASQLTHAIQIIVAIEPTLFDQLVAEAEAEYGAGIVLGKQPVLAKDGRLAASIELKPGYCISLIPDEGYLIGVLGSLKQNLLLAAVVLSSLTIGLLLLLVRRFITGSITELDTQLTLVMNDQLENIDKPNSSDEVGRLGRKFHQLYDQLNESFQQTKQLSLTDTLTQLPNRVSFYESAQRELAFATNLQQPLTFIYIDLDNFKFVNDKYGHEVGDGLLKAVANKLKLLLEINAEHTGVKALISRLSGDEFVVLLPGLPATESLKVADKILGVFIDGFHFELGDFPVTASVGIAAYPDDGHTVTQLISNSDLAMYQAKKTGKNQYAKYSQALAKKARRDKEIEQQLKALICDEEFSLVYMPVVDRKGKVVGCEALLRWQSPVLGRVGPDEFIPIAEAVGLFEMIDFWVLDNALKDFAQLQDIFGGAFVLSINISSAELSSDRIKNYLFELISRYRVPNHQIELEITETFGSDHSAQALNLLRALRKDGVQIAIDDFGTGYTSLMQMMDYPVDKIKLDKTFIERMTQKDKRGLLAPVINLCHLQGMTVTAEGVETIDQQELILQSRCDYLQGYLIATPMPLSELRKWHNPYAFASTDKCTV